MTPILRKNPLKKSPIGPKKKVNFGTFNPAPGKKLGMSRAKNAASANYLNKIGKG